MTDSQSIYKGDTAGPWNVGVTGDDGALVTITAPWTCAIKVAGTAIGHSVTDRTSDNKRFIAALTPAETLMLEDGQYVVAIEIENTTTTPPVRREHHIILTVTKHVVGSTDEPGVDDVYLGTLGLTALQDMRVNIWNALSASVAGTRIKEVWRDGRRVVRENMSTKELRDMLTMVDAMIREQEIVTGVSTTPRRTAIGLAYG